MKSESDCPRTEQLSALIDDELAAEPREAIASHAAVCPLCGPLLLELTEQRALMHSLAGTRPGVDLVPEIDRRLAPRPRPRPKPAEGSWWRGWRLAPAGLAAASVLATGIYSGALLTAGAGIAVARPTAMAAFDPVPPGGICVGVPSCYSRGR